MRILLAAVLLLVACERAPREAIAPATTHGGATTAQQEPSGQTVASPTPVAPKSPDYEDATGVVREEGGAFELLVEGDKPICLPFEAPAEARIDGVRVRFTLYLSSDVAPTGCRPVQSLISMRTVSE